MKKLSILVWILALSAQLYAEKINVFVAASARYAMSEVREEFLKNRSSDEIELSFGASGKAYQQLKAGFPFDMYMAADSKYPAQVKSDGNAAGEPRVYALGAVALYSLDEALLKDGVAVAKRVKNFSIANPKVAPYGVAAVEILKSSGVYDEVEPKLVLGDNISQAVHFVDSGAAEVGLVALSLLRQGDGAKGKYVVIAQSEHAPLKQSFVITKRAENSVLAKEFAEFIVSKRAHEIFEKYGFSAPKE
ncbi:MAG: molybdate ABC transporter substrate-binding protein [Wolinella sp.]